MRQGSWPQVALVVAAGVVAALQVGKVSIGLPAMRAELGLGLAEAGWVMALFALLGAAAGMPAGALVDRMGDRRLLVGALLTLAAGSVVGALAGGLPLLLLARVVEGAGFLGVLVAAPALLQRVVGAQCKLAFGLWGSFMPAGIAMALLAGPALDGWRAFWIANAGLAMVLAALLQWQLPAGPRPAASPAVAASIGGQMRRVLATAQPRWLALAFASYALQYFALVSFLPTLLMHRLQVPVADAGVVAAAAVAANIVGNVAAGLLMARGATTATLVIVANAVTGVAGVGIFAGTLPDGAVFCLCLLFSAVGGLLPASVIAASMQSMAQPRLAPVALGLTVQGNNIGQLIGPVAVGSAVAAAGWPAAGAVVGVSATLGAWCGWRLRRHPTLHAPSQPVATENPR